MKRFAKEKEMNGTPTFESACRKMAYAMRDFASWHFTLHGRYGEGVMAHEPEMLRGLRAIGDAAIAAGEETER